MADITSVQPLTETRLKKARTLRSLSQTEAARRSDVSQSYWGSLERGESQPTIEVAYRIAAALGFAVHELWPPPTPGASPDPSQGAVA